MSLILSVVNEVLGVPEEFRFQYFLRDSISGSRIAKEVGVHAPARCSVEETKNALINRAHWHEGLVKDTVTCAEKLTSTRFGLVGYPAEPSLLAKVEAKTKVDTRLSPG
jgi:hypothetical protein